MPPKKRKADAGVSSAAARQVEADFLEKRRLEEEELRRRKEAEDLRVSEEVSRRLLEEEERRVALDIQLRNESVYYSICSVDQQRRFDEQVDQFEKKLSRQADELFCTNATVMSLEEQNIRARLENDAVHRQLALLAQELKDTRRRLQTAGEEAERSERTAMAHQREMEQEVDQLRVQLTSAREAQDAIRGEKDALAAQVAALEKELTSLGDVADMLGVEVTSAIAPSLAGVTPAVQGVEATEIDRVVEGVALAKTRGEAADTKILLKLLNEELAQHKQLLAEYKSRTEAMEREEEKGSLLMSILSSQLDAVREDNCRLHTAMAEQRQAASQLHEQIASLKAAGDALQTEFNTAVSQAATREKIASVEIEVHKKQVDELSRRLEQREDELRRSQASLEALSAEADTSERQFYAERVELRGELDRLRAELERVHSTLKESLETSQSKDATQLAEIESLRARLRKLHEQSETKEHGLIEKNLVLTADIQQLRAELTRSEKSHEARVEQLKSEEASLREALDAEKQAFSTHRTVADEKERTYFQKLVQITASHDAAQQQLERLQRVLATKEKDLVDSRVFLGAENETIKLQLEEAQRKLEAARAQHASHVTKSIKEAKELQERADTAASGYKAQLADANERLEQLQEQCRTAEDTVARLEQEAKRVAAENWTKSTRLKAEIRDAESELTAAKRTIERLEGELSGVFRFRRQDAADRSLQQQIGELTKKNQLLESTIVAMKTQDILDSELGGRGAPSARERVLKDQNDVYARRLHDLETSQRAAVSLLRDVRAVLEETGLMATIEGARARFERAIVGQFVTPHPPPTASAAESAATYTARPASGGAYRKSSLRRTEVAGTAEVAAAGAAADPRGSWKEAAPHPNSVNDDSGPGQEVEQHASSFDPCVTLPLRRLPREICQTGTFLPELAKPATVTGASTSAAAAPGHPCYAVHH